jgi:hypothetical protein
MATKRLSQIESVSHVEVNLDGSTHIEATRPIGKDEISLALRDTHYTVAS